MGAFFKSRLFFISLAVVIIASTLPLYVSGYILGLLTVTVPKEQRPEPVKIKIGGGQKQPALKS